MKSSVNLTSAGQRCGFQRPVEKRKRVNKHFYSKTSVLKNPNKICKILVSKVSAALNLKTLGSYLRLKVF